MRIVLAAQPATGHLNPILGIARLLVQSGHEAIIYTGSVFRDQVTAIGAVFEPLPVSVDFDLRDPDALFPERKALTGAAATKFDFERIFVGPMATQFFGLAELIKRTQPDGVITENLFFGTVPLMLAPRETRPFVATASISFLPLARGDGLPNGLGLPYATDPAARSQLLETVGPAVAAAFAPVQATFDASLREIGVVPRGDPMSAAVTFADAVWQGGVPDLDYPLAHPSSHVEHIGAWPRVAGPVTFPEWMERLDDRRRIVLVTQGTVSNLDLEQLVLPTMRALAHRDDLIVMGTGGGRDVADIAVPANARLESYLPFDMVLPSVDAFVTNGGFGSVLQALASGVPMAIAGATEDKPEIAARIDWAGAGINLGTDRPSEAKIAHAVDALLAADSPHRARARAIADAFASTDGAERILATVERLGAQVRCVA
jgi:UDP:flavonoid glycosyltransferase YjiC (YdhE family)